MENFVKMSMNFHPKTVEKVDNLGELLHENNKTRVVSTSITIANEIVNLIRGGNRIIIKSEDGTEQELKLLV